MITFIILCHVQVGPGPNPLADLDRGVSMSVSGFAPGGPNLGGVRIRWDTDILETPKDIDDFTIAPLTDQILVLGGIVVPKADVGCQKKCPAMVKVGLSRFQKLIGELASVYHR